MASLVNIKTDRQLSLGLHLRLNELKNKKQAQTTRVAWCHWCSHGRLKSNTLLPDPRHHLPCVLYGKHTQQPRRAGCCCPHRRGPFAGDSTTSNHRARRTWLGGALSCHVDSMGMEPRSTTHGQGSVSFVPSMA
jgi:hypothetical protein